MWNASLVEERTTVSDDEDTHVSCQDQEGRDADVGLGELNFEEERQERLRKNQRD